MDPGAIGDFVLRPGPATGMFQVFWVVQLNSESRYSIEGSVLLKWVK